MCDAQRPSFNDNEQCDDDKEKSPYKSSVSIQVTKYTDDDLSDKDVSEDDSIAEVAFHSTSRKSKPQIMTDESGQSDEYTSDAGTRKNGQKLRDESSQEEPGLLRNRRRRAGSRAWLLKLKKVKAAKDRDSSALTSPETEDSTILGRWNNTFGHLLKSDLKDAVSRSKSLESHVRRSHSNRSPDYRYENKLKPKMKLFKSLSSLEKPTLSISTSHEELESNKSIDSNQSTSPMLKYFTKSSRKSCKKSNGDIKTIFNYAVKTSGNDTLTNFETTTKNSVSNMIVSVSNSIPAGALLAEGPPSVSTNTLESSPANQVDTVDGFMPSFNDAQKSKQMIESIKQKIIKTSEILKVEQAQKEDNVTEYLRLATNADKAQAVRIKLVFEKKNQKSNATITQLQKKLDIYHKKLKELDNGSGKQGFMRDVSANLRDFSGGVVDSFKLATQNAAGVIVGKPKVVASRFKNRFGSADNLSSMKEDSDIGGEDYLYPGSGDDISSTSGSVENITSIGSNEPMTEELYQQRLMSYEKRHSSHTDNTQQLQSIASQLLDIKNELQKVRQLQSNFEKEIKSNKEGMESSLTRLLEEEKLRHEDQLNDVNEYHRREITVLKQELTSLEEKMEYHAHERARDVQEALESCQTRIAKMELQQQRQSVSVEGLENATARALIGKLINLLLSVMAVLLVLVSTISGILMPFIKSQGRVFVTVLVTIISILIYRNWDSVLAWYQLIGS